MSKLIYIADDEEKIRELLKTFLNDAGYEAVAFEDGEKLLKRFKEAEPELVILDIMMPGRDGMEICDELRKLSKVPIILLTAKDTEMDYVMGMEAGCDDYMMKPFRPTMLLMKIKSIFRRIDMEREGREAQRDYDIRGLVISARKQAVYYRDRELKLTRTEFLLLSYFAGRYGEAVSREELLQNIWGYQPEVETRVVDENVRRIRSKMREAGCRVRIETVWGYGYRMCDVGGKG